MLFRFYNFLVASNLTLRYNTFFLQRRFIQTQLNMKDIVKDIIKSPEDTREYRGLILKNDLKVLLISDPTTDKSAAALDVNIGCMSDPVDLPGLAHFCEHMLFMGTKKFPDENDYSKFLSEHGGSSNAYTSSENTNYFFDVSPEHFASALDRFAQFFINPLFTASATGREVLAVNSENDKNLKNDSWRLHQMDQSTCNPDHPYSKFGTGNLDTLETLPKQRNQDVREELLKFHSEYYSANIMALTVLAKETLDELTALVESLFSDIENKNVTVPTWPSHPLSAPHLMKIIQIVPIKDVRSLKLSWPTPDYRKFYKANPEHYLGHLIGHEGGGSLLSLLKKNGWVNTLMSGKTDGARGFSFFTLQVDLTETGIEHVFDIVKSIYQYFNLLRKEGPKEWIFRECQSISKIAFQFSDKQRPSDYTSKCSTNLQEYPINEVLSAEYYYDEFMPDIISEILSHLRPDNMRMNVIGKKYEGKTDLVEKWYGTNYSITPMSEEDIKLWENADLNDNLHLPDKNEFIASDFSLLARDETTDTPIMIRNTSFSRLWYLQDKEFNLPKACYTTLITSPFVYTDPLCTNLTHLYTELLKDALNEYAYSAELAGISYKINNTIYGIIMSFHGYNEKLDVFIRKVVEKIVNFNIDEKRFCILLENYIRSLKNFNAEQPHQHATYYTSLLMAEQMWSKEELLEATQEMVYEKLKTFHSLMFSRVHIEMLAYGNISKEKGNKVADIFEELFQSKCASKPLLPSQFRHMRQIKLPNGSSFLYERENTVHKSNALEVYYQCGLQDTHNNMLLELFCQIIDEPCFDILRTQEQLGYLVFSGVRRSNGVQGFHVIVQSDKCPKFVEGRVENFVKKMRDHLKKMSDETFTNHVMALASKRLERPKKMYSRNNKFWAEISNRFYQFDRDAVEVKHLKDLKKSDIENFYMDLLSALSPNRHKLSTHVISTGTHLYNEEGEENEEEDGKADVKKEKVEDVMAFKRQMELFPLHKSLIPIPFSFSKL